MDRSANKQRGRETNLNCANSCSSFCSFSTSWHRRARSISLFVFWSDHFLSLIDFFYLWSRSKDTLLRPETLPFSLVLPSSHVRTHHYPPLTGIMKLFIPIILILIKVILIILITDHILICQSIEYPPLTGKTAGEHPHIDKSISQARIIIHI